MSPMEWAVRPLKRYAQFSGRSSRAEFWWFILGLVVVYVGMSFILGIVAGLAAGSSGQTEPSAAAFGAIGLATIFIIIFWLALLIPIIAVQTRRLHDTNRSGYWLLGYYAGYFIYLVLMFGVVGSVMTSAMAGGTAPPDNLGPMFAVVMGFGFLFFIYSIVLLVFYCQPGTKGANKYGDDPYGNNVEEVFA